MKAIFISIIAGLLFTACSSTKKIPAATTTIPTNTTPVKNPTVKIEKPKIENYTPNPNIKMVSITGKWKFESSSEKDIEPIVGQSLPEITFNEADRKVTGTTGCNIFNGFFFTTGELFNFSPLAVKKKKCNDVKLEKYLTSFLKEVGSYKTTDNKIYLYHKNDHSKYLVFSKIGR